MDRAKAAEPPTVKLLRETTKPQGMSALIHLPGFRQASGFEAVQDAKPDIEPNQPTTQ